MLDPGYQIGGRPELGGQGHISGTIYYLLSAHTQMGEMGASSTGLS